MLPRRLKMNGQMLISLAAACTASYVLLSPTIAAPLYNSMLFYPDYPTRYEASRYEFQELLGVPKQDLHVALPDGTKLHAWFFKHPRSQGLVIINHGNAGNISDRTALANDLLELRQSVLLYDYEGYGLSEGKPSIPNICRDGLTMYDYAREKLGYADKNIVLWGESLGCAVACEMSRQRPCQALILESGFSSLKSIAGEKLWIMHAYPTAFFPKPHLDNLSILTAPHPPLLLIHGELDTTVPPAHSRLMFAKAAEPKRLLILPHSGHYVATEDNPAFMDVLRSFFASLATN